MVTIRHLPSAWPPSARFAPFRVFGRARGSLEPRGRWAARTVGSESGDREAGAIAGLRRRGRTGAGGQRPSAGAQPLRGSSVLELVGRRLLQHLLRRGDPALELLQGVHAQGEHPLPDRLLLDLAGGAPVAGSCRGSRRRSASPRRSRRARGSRSCCSRSSRAPCMKVAPAACSGLELQLARAPPAAGSRGSRHLAQTRRTSRWARIRFVAEATRNGSIPMSIEPVQGRGRVVGVHGGEDEVAGEGGLDRDGGGLLVADLPHHDDVRVLAQERPAGPRRR